MATQCEICGETKFDGGGCCPACGHPYPDDDEEDDDDDGDDGDDDG